MSDKKRKNEEEKGGEEPEDFSQFFAFCKPVYGAPQDAPAAKYMLPDTQEYATVSDGMITVPRRTGSSSGTYDGVLNERGKELLADTLRRVEAKQFKDVLSNYTLEVELSGYWHDEKTGMQYLNTHNNLFVTGDLRSDPQRRVDTSMIVFFDENNGTSGWALTNGGSLYALEKPMAETEDKTLYAMRKQINNK
jgi:hypothetical protein